MIYTYTEEFFLSKKNEIDISKIDENLNNVFKEIYNNYPCFSEVKNNQSNYKKNYRHKKDNYYGRYRSNLNDEIIRKKKRTDVQIILGYFNKLTNKTYDDLSNKIINDIDEDNYIKIIDKLFEISYKQTSYYELYINLYKKILNEVKDDNIVKKINDYLLSKINNIINDNNNELNLIKNHTDKIKLEYDDFCDINKNAKNLKGQIFIISNLIKHKIIDLEKDTLIDNLFKYENYDNEIFLELLQILNNIIGLDDNKINVLQNYVDISDFKGKMMLKFKLKDIIENKLIRIF